MSNLPSELLYTNSHEWLRVGTDNLVTIGVTEHAQSLLGDMVFIELPDLNIMVQSSDEIGVLESVKAASDLYAPVSGEIVEVNTAILDAPSLVNSDPYGDGWLVQMRMQDVAELESLSNAAAYAELIAEEE